MRRSGKEVVTIKEVIKKAKTNKGNPEVKGVAMKHTMSMRTTVFATSVLALGLGVGMVGQSADLNFNLISTACAEEGGAGGHKGPGSGKGGSPMGGAGQKGQADQGQRRGMDKVLSESDDDSDRPPWAMGNKDLNYHRGDGNASAGTKKGDLFGDLWVILRNDDGTPVYVTWVDSDGDGVNDTMQPCTSENCFVQPIDASGEVIALDAEGAPLDPKAVIEVELGRTNVARAPDSVLEHALTEALSKLDGTTLGVEVTTDAAGRLVLPDGVTTIDSPLENLALFEAVVTATDIDGDGNLDVKVVYSGEGGISGTYSFEVPTTDQLDLAASLFAASADKTGVLTVDQVYNVSLFLGVADELSSLVESAGYSDPAGVDEYATTEVTIMQLVDDGGTPDDPLDDTYAPTVVKIPEVVEFNVVQPIVADGNGIDTFAQDADDALQVLEYVHDNGL